MGETEAERRISNTPKRIQWVNVGGTTTDEGEQKNSADPMPKRPAAAPHNVYRGKEAFLQKRKQIDEAKRNHKAKMLRDYAKLCKREGVASDRVNMHGSSSSNNNDTATAAAGTSKPAAAKKANPFRDAELAARQKAEEKQREQQRQEQVQREIQAKAKARERQRAERMKRTRKGQPIMATQIKNILGKLTAERAAAASASSTG